MHTLSNEVDSVRVYNLYMLHEAYEFVGSITNGIAFKSEIQGEQYVKVLISINKHLSKRS